MEGDPQDAANEIPGYSAHNNPSVINLLSRGNRQQQSAVSRPESTVNSTIPIYTVPNRASIHPVNWGQKLRL